MSEAEDDLALLQRWRDGDSAAGDVLIRRYYEYAYKMARFRLAGDDDGAKEVTQRAFEAVLRKRDEISTSFKGYLRRVVELQVLSQRRRKEPVAGASQLPGDERRLDSAIVQREETKLMVKALRRLSVEDQLLLAWAYCDDKSQQEIAESLGLRPAQCNMKMYRARQRLKAKLEAFQKSRVRQSTLGGFETWLASVHGHADGD